MTNNATHTPGPWYVNDKRGGAFSGQTHVMTGQGYDAFSICMMQGGQHMESPEQQANARLIAVAPKLLEALEAIRNAVKAEPAMNHHKYDALGVQVNAAIAEATGRAA